MEKLCFKKENTACVAYQDRVLIEHHERVVSFIESKSKLCYKAPSKKHTCECDVQIEAAVG